MQIDPSRAAALATTYRQVTSCMARASHTCADRRPVRLVAVSKLKPATDILALHNSDLAVAHFGENYAQELMQKAELLPRSIQWHFIGALQSNKCKSLAQSVPNLFCVSSVDSTKKASQLDKGRAELSPRADVKLNIHIQINTSGEANKSGASPGEDVTALVKHVLESCPQLHLLGFMTIGAIARSQAAGAADDDGANEDFTALRDERDRVARELQREAEHWELSMGMSNDFEAAIRQGSGEVRVGSTIFGARPNKEEFSVV